MINLTDYQEFLSQKRMLAPTCGIQIDVNHINSKLFPFQRDLVKWALRKGRCALFCECGLGKSFMQIEWARLLGQKTLIIAPLSVARQTVNEGKKLGVEIHYTRSQENTIDGINITNYEMIEHFDASQFGAVVLDESSLLKGLDSKTRVKLTDMFTNTPYRLCCTATPAPNDYVELGNHAEFLGLCTEAEMRAMFFINANKEHTIVVDDKVYRQKGSNKGGQEWRLKHSAEKPFFEWLSSWSIMLTKPSDLDYEDNGFILPPLEITPHFVESNYVPEGQLFFTHLHGIQDRVMVRRNTLDVRLDKLQELIDNSEDQWIVWVGLDDESKAVSSILKNAVEVKGADSPEYKAETFEAFQDGKVQILVTKARIGGLGMNFQNASHMCFFGLNDSWELWYQAIRRQWRFGQKQPVYVHAILSDAESEIYANIMRKDAMASRLRQGLVEQIGNYEKDELNVSNQEDTECNNYLNFILPEWLERQHDLRVQLSDLRETCQNQAQSSEYQGITEVLQSEVQRNCQAQYETRTDAQCAISLPQLRKVGNDIQKPCGEEELCSEVLQSQVFRRSAEGAGESCVVRWAIFPKWIRGDLST